MLKDEASLIAELLTNAGWVDDADELLGDMLDNGMSREDVLARAKIVDNLVAKVNAALPPDERITVKAELTLNDL